FTHLYALAARPERCGGKEESDQPRSLGNDSEVDCRGNYRRQGDQRQGDERKGRRIDRAHAFQRVVPDHDPGNAVPLPRPGLSVLFGRFFSIAAPRAIAATAPEPRSSSVACASKSANARPTPSARSGNGAAR